MNCPYCEETSKVVDSRPTHDGIRRRRECLTCGRRFTTHERIVPLDVRIMKRANRPTEGFLVEKLLTSFKRVCKGRPVPEESVKAAARRIEASVVDSGKGVIQSHAIAQMVLEELRALDVVAFQRFASNYATEDGKPSLLTQDIQVEESAQYVLFEDMSDSQRS